MPRDKTDVVRRSLFGAGRRPLETKMASPASGALRQG
jgi:hypothetical protein